MRYNRPSSFLPIKYFSLFAKLSQTVVIKYYSNFSLIFMQDSGYQWLKPIHKTLILKLNDIIHQLHYLAGHRTGCFKFPIIQPGDRLDLNARMAGKDFVGL